MRLCGRWVSFVSQRAWTVLVVSLGLSALALWYAAANLSMNSDPATLVSEEEPFRQNSERFKRLFPELDDVALVVVRGGSGLESESAALAYAERLRAEEEFFVSVYVPGTGPFFERYGLLYLDVEDLSETVNNLAEAQPALAKLASDPSLRGVFDTLDLGLDAISRGEDLPVSYAELIEQVAKVADATGTGDGEEGLDLAPNMLGGYAGTDIRLIVVEPVMDYSIALPPRAAIERMRALEAEMRDEGAIPDDVSVRLTGDVVLHYDEMMAIRDGVSIAGAVSLVLLMVILGFGMRSGRLIFASYSTLFVGFAWSAAWAMFSVGGLNTLSAAVAVLFIGLGIDHAIHFCLRYREACAEGMPNREALSVTTSSVGIAIMICGLSSAIGFFAFIPTDYLGFAELGIIAGGAMVMALIASLTVLPALLTITRAARRRRQLSSGSLFAHGLIEDHGSRIAVGLLVVCLLSVFIAREADFDFSTLALKNPDAESVTTLEELDEEEIVTDYTAVVIADNLEEAEALAQRLEALPEVSQAITPYSFVPKEQELKLEILEEATSFLWPALNPMFMAEPPSDGELVEDARDLLDEVRAARTEVQTSEMGSALAQLEHALDDILSQPDPLPRLRRLEELLVEQTDAQLERLRKALEAELVAYETLPKDMLDREIAVTGEVRVSVIPEEDIKDLESLRRFVEALKSVAPEATGRPVTEAGVGKIVVDSFIEAAIIATIAIFFFLWALIRRLSDVVIVMLPLAFAFSLTAATTVLLNMPFNFANVIVLPLLLGFGVDSGIHLVHRRRYEASVGEVMHSSTPRAVALSAMTTIGSFGALALSPHWGTATMGILLSFGMTYIVLCTVILLPALMRWRDMWLSPKADSSRA